MSFQSLCTVASGAFADHERRPRGRPWLPLVSSALSHGYQVHLLDLGAAAVVRAALGFLHVRPPRTPRIKASIYSSPSHSRQLRLAASRGSLQVVVILKSSIRCPSSPLMSHPTSSLQTLSLSLT